MFREGRVYSGGCSQCLSLDSEYGGSLAKNLTRDGIGEITITAIVFVFCVYRARSEYRRLIQKAEKLPIRFWGTDVNDALLKEVSVQSML